MSRGDDRRDRDLGRGVRVSLARRRACQWLLLPAAQLALPSAWAAASRVASARVWPAQEYTRVIVESKDAEARPRISIKEEGGKTRKLPGSSADARYLLPVGSNILVDEGQKVQAGDTLQLQWGARVLDIPLTEADIQSRVTADKATMCAGQASRGESR